MDKLIFYYTILWKDKNCETERWNSNSNDDHEIKREYFEKILKKLNK
jgi:hypothetical protein